MEIFLLVIITFGLSIAIAGWISEKFNLKIFEFFIFIFVMWGMINAIVAIGKFNPNPESSNIQKINRVIDMQPSLDKTDAKVEQILRDVGSGIYPFIVTNQIWFYGLFVSIALLIAWVKYRTYVINERNKEIDEFNKKIQNLINTLDNKWQRWDDFKFSLGIDNRRNR